MALAPVGDASGEYTGPNYDLIGTTDTDRIEPDGSFTPIVVITAQSKTYGVTFTFTLLRSTVDTDSAPPFIQQKTSEVDAVCAHAHVQDFYTESDQGPGQRIFNYAVISVGTDDGAITLTTRRRMDQLGDAATFTAIDQTWNRVQSLISGT